MAEITNTQLLQKIGIVLKELRAKENLTQDRVYIDTNIHIGRLETATRNFSISTLAALCDYFEISMAEFFRRVEKIK
ncbi:MAG: helix-turn-helix transcriptional regulator [Rhizobacter sp.]|nr:helix-turn-helix transcriptional regulator [Ferruginibacter sp.]